MKTMIEIYKHLSEEDQFDDAEDWNKNVEKKSFETPKFLFIIPKNVSKILKNILLLKFKRDNKQF